MIMQKFRAWYGQKWTWTDCWINIGEKQRIMNAFGLLRSICGQFHVSILTTNTTTTATGTTTTTRTQQPQSPEPAGTDTNKFRNKETGLWPKVAGRLWEFPLIRIWIVYKDLSGNKTPPSQVTEIDGPIDISPTAEFVHLRIWVSQQDMMTLCPVSLHDGWFMKQAMWPIHQWNHKDYDDHQEKKRWTWFLSRPSPALPKTTGS